MTGVAFIAFGDTAFNFPVGILSGTRIDAGALAELVLCSNREYIAVVSGLCSIMGLFTFVVTIFGRKSCGAKWCADTNCILVVIGFVDGST